MPPSALLRPKQLRLRSGTGTGSRLQRSAQRTTKLVVAVSAQQTLLFCNKIQLRYFVLTYLLGRKAFRFIFRASHASFCFLFSLQKKSFELVSPAVRQLRVLLYLGMLDAIWCNLMLILNHVNQGETKKDKFGFMAEVMVCNSHRALKFVGQLDPRKHKPNINSVFHRVKSFSACIDTNSQCTLGGANSS